MSETNEILASRTFLEVCMGIEGLCAELYHFYSTIFEDIPEAARLWNKTALEEENHRMQFELALRLVEEAEFEVPKERLKQAFSIHHKLLDFLNNIKSNKPGLLTAVSKAVEMEEKLADLHVHTSLQFKDDSMQRLFKVLGEADRGHVADLQCYKSILYLPFSEMKG